MKITGLWFYTESDEAEYHAMPVLRRSARLDVLIDGAPIYPQWPPIGTHWIYRCFITWRIIVLSKRGHAPMEVDTLRLFGLAPIAPTPYETALLVSDALIRINA